MLSVIDFVKYVSDWKLLFYYTLNAWAYFYRKLYKNDTIYCSVLVCFVLFLYFFVFSSVCVRLESEYPFSIVRVSALKS